MWEQLCLDVYNRKLLFILVIILKSVSTEMWNTFESRSNVMVE